MHLAAAGVTGPVDLLSLDLDGMDCRIWKAIKAIDPRVVVCETHNVAPIGRAIAVPYDPKFVCNSENYRGASLEAMCRLGKEKGYRLVGTHRFGFNAFFVKDVVGNDFPNCCELVFERSLHESAAMTGPRSRLCHGMRLNKIYLLLKN
jgi:hypothetical protein